MTWLRLLPPWAKHRWRHRTLGELFLLGTALGAAADGLTLLCAPHNRTSSPALVTLYTIAPRPTWGVAFLLLAALAVYAALHPAEERFVVVMSIEVAAQTAWAIGLIIPTFDGSDVSNLLAPIAWLQLASTALIVVTAGHRPVLPPPVNKGRRRTDRMG